MAEHQADIEHLIQDTNLDVREQVERIMHEENEDPHVFARKNIYQGFVNASMDAVTSEEGGIFVYDHSPGFEEGETGYARLRGVGDTGYLPLEVQSAEALPDPSYENSDYIEMAVEHDDIRVDEGRLGTLQVVPYNPNQLGSDSWREVLDSYNPEDGELRHRSLT
ncbi:MAG: hypothetical protein ACI977_000648 [Candidatus Nanohaloarchaea archaeon]|jgi:hypothetical protein